MNIGALTEFLSGKLLDFNRRTQGRCEFQPSEQDDKKKDLRCLVSRSSNPSPVDFPQNNEYHICRTLDRKKPMSSTVWRAIDQSVGFCGSKLRSRSLTSQGEFEGPELCLCSEPRPEPSLPYRSSCVTRGLKTSRCPVCIQQSRELKATSESNLRNTNGREY
jgi:hypothetical protein